MKAKRTASAGGRERGYAMLSLVAAMAVAAIVLGAAVTPVKHRMQREKEEEMLWRGAQVAEAISKYFQMRGGQFPASLPTKLEDLAAEYNINGKKLYLVRQSAMRDPMTGDGEWKAVRVGDPMVGELYRAFVKYASQQQPPPQMPPLLQQAAVMSGVTVTGPGGGQDGAAAADSGSAFKPGSAFALSPESRPIIGVVSNSKEKLIRNYFGLASYDRALFFPGLQMPGGMMFFAVGGAAGGGGDQGGTSVQSKIITDPNCPPDSARQGLCKPFWATGS
jgi:type II secretory pathway pseudopilin PulG